MLIDEELVRTVLIKDFDYFCDRPTLDLREDNYLRHMLISLKVINIYRSQQILGYVIQEFIMPIYYYLLNKFEI